jgi:hypothetical protein
VRKNKLPPGWYHKDGESNFIRYYNGKKWQEQTLPVPPDPSITHNDSKRNDIENDQAVYVSKNSKEFVTTELQLPLPLENNIAEDLKKSEENPPLKPEIGKAFALALLPIGGEQKTKLKVFTAIISSLVIGTLLTIYSIDNETSLFVNTPSIETITLANSLLTEVKYIATNNGREEINYRDFLGMDMDLSNPGLDAIDNKNGPWKFTGEDGTYLLITQTGTLDVNDL